jgi:hypothetical protein
VAVSAYMFGQALAKSLNKEIAWLADNIKTALIKDTWVPAQDTNQYWSDVVANETAGTGYTAGGATLASKTLTYDGSTNKTKLAAANPQWPASTITARYACLYDDSPSTNATKPVLGYVDFGANQSTSNTTFEIVWAAAGIFEITAA